MGDFKKSFILAHNVARSRAVDAVRSAPDGFVVEIREQTRSLEASAKFHALCSDLAASRLEWMGKYRTAAQWKVLLVSGHSVATGTGVELVPGLEGEIVNVRESTASMSVRRISSLIEYTQAFCDDKGIKTGGPYAD